MPLHIKTHLTLNCAQNGSAVLKRLRIDGVCSDRASVGLETARVGFVRWASGGKAGGGGGGRRRHDIIRIRISGMHTKHTS